MAKHLGFDYRKTWTQPLPTDGVWVTRGDGIVIPVLPVVALEVVVTEGAKSIRGTADVLSEVSPSLGLIVVDEEEIRRALASRGLDLDRVDSEIAHKRDLAAAAARRADQRIEVWSKAQLTRAYQLITGDARPATLGRLLSAA